jgi:importin subunit alpha-6/7
VWVACRAQALEPLLQNIAQPSSVSLLKNAVWTLSNFCRGKPQPPLERVRPAIPMLATLLAQCQDTDVLQDACWALSYLSDGDNSRIQVGRRRS